MCCRSSAKGSAAITSITALYPNAYISLLGFDHMELSSVVAAAKEFLSKETVLHGLVNNAGIMATPFEITKDGYEAQWQTNYFAHWVFTSHLLPLLLSTSKALPPGSVRVVNLSSAGHWSAPKGGIVFEDTSLANEQPMTRYGQSKLGNVLHTKTLHKLYGPGSPSTKAGNGEIWSSAVHPGLVESNLGATSEFPKVMKVVIELFATLGGRVDGDKGSWTSVFCAASTQMKSTQSGTYFQRIAEAGWQSSMAKDAALAAKLEVWTIKEMKGKGLVD
jgi:NAD(P)-dependent dehydrogenase (short-subunit alcohol dehydrogenase family)